MKSHLLPHFFTFLALLCIAPGFTINVQDHSYSQNAVSVNYTVSNLDDILPLAFQISGGGNYCAGNPGIEVGLQGSEIGVTYDLLLNDVPTNIFLNGTGFPISFGLQTAGIYTIAGSNPYGIMLMTGSALVTEEPNPVVSIIVDEDTVCSGSIVNFSSIVSDVDNPTYQWYRLSTPTGNNEPTLTFNIFNGESVKLLVTSPTGCNTYSNSIRIVVPHSFAAVNFTNHGPLQVVAEEEVTLDTYLFNAGLNPDFEWFVNGAKVPGNDCQLTYTPGPADTVLVKMTPGDEVPCLYYDAYFSDPIYIYSCTGPPIAYDVWGETNTCDGEIFIFGLSNTDDGIYYEMFQKFGNIFYPTHDFWGNGEPFTDYRQSSDFYFKGTNACGSTWMNGHADLYPYDTRATITVSDNNICSGNEVSFHATSNQPDTTTYLYYWILNQYNWISISAELNLTPQNGDVVTALMYYPCFDNLHFPENNSILMMVNDCTGASTTWTGNINENWFELNNWDNGVPDAGTIVVIPGGLTDYPTLTSTAYCSSIILEDGASFIGGEFLNEKSALVKRNLIGPEFHFLSSPVSPQPLFGDVFPTDQNTIWVRRYYENEGEWINMKALDPFNAGKGYSIQQTPNHPHTAQFIGLLNGANISTQITNYNPSGLYDWAGWNLLGNPFPSSIDWDLIPHTFIESSVYVWNGVQYISWNGTIGALENGIIPPQNGFFVKATANYWKSITIPSVSRVHANKPFYKELPSNVIELTVHGNNYSDKAYVHFNNNATAGFDPQFDARKLWGIEEAPQLFCYAEGTELSINEKPFEIDETTDLGFKCGIDGDFALTISGLAGFDNKLNILIEDMLKGKFYNPKQNPEICFNSEKSDPETRFRIHFNYADHNPENDQISLYCIGRKLFIENKTGLPFDLEIYDLSGRFLIAENQFNSSTFQIPFQFANGMYIVKCRNDNAHLSEKINIR